MNAHNTNPMIEPNITAIHLATLFMRLRLEMDALPRLTDMLLFVFIVRHFFYASIDYRSFACSLKVWRAEARKGCSPSAEKYKLTNGRSGDFSVERQKNSPAPHVFQLRASNASLVDGTAINWSVDSVPVKTNINILATEGFKE
ncbi:MAG: hypothetical protein K2N05_05240 [Muribaculaceae bacterium]|nr:hypothetical protein [Muribaculaceae bacterium]